MPETKPPLWRIALATTPEQVGRCSSVMRELRPHIKAIEFAARVLQQQKEGYQLAFLELDGVIRSVAGIRILNLLFSGRTLYVDDLVTHAVELAAAPGERCHPEPRSRRGTSQTLTDFRAAGNSTTQFNG